MRGSLRKRSKNAWTIILDAGRDVSGKRRQQWISVKGTRKDAERKLTSLTHAVDTGSFVKPTRLTVGDFLRRWLRDYVATNVRSKTREGYCHKVERHLIPSIGSIPLTSLQPSHIQECYAKALAGGRLDRDGGLSARTVLHLHRILSEALSHAVKWGLLAHNMAEAVDPPRANAHQMLSLDGEEVRRLLEAATGTVYYPLIHLAVFTGLRRSELLGLRWKDVNLYMATISVVQVMHHLRDGQVVFEEPKSAKGRRMVALSPSAVLALRAHRERQEADRAMLETPLSGGCLVFSHADGTPLLPNTVTHAFIKLARRTGLQGVRLHDLRHTHASLMLRQGIHPKIVSERLGHATIGITLDTYSHVTPGLQEAAALRFEEELEPKNLPTFADISARHRSAAVG